MMSTGHPTAPRRLSPEDRAILDLERGPIVGHTCKVILLGDPAPDAAALRERISARLSGAPELTLRLEDDPNSPEWVPLDGLDLADHVVGHDEREPLDARALRDEVAELFAERLPRDRPLWRMDVFPLAAGGRALVWRTHHALADGTTCVRLANAILLDAEPGAEPAGAAHRAHAAADDARRRAHLAGFVEREFARSLKHSPFDGRVGRRRVVAFATVPLQPLHDAAKGLAGATLNDAVLAAVGGGVQRWLAEMHASIHQLRIKVPVSLHNQDAEAGNRDSFFEVTVPVAEPDPVKRLHAVHAAAQVRKERHDADEMDAILAELRRLSPRLEHLCQRIERSPRSFALNVSNVPGPPGPVSICGAPVESLYSFAEIGERHALRVAVVSCAGNLHFGLCADPEIVGELDALARGVEDEAQALVAAA